MLKLIRWKIVTHGGVDGKTRLVVFLQASDNNRAETVAAAFRSGTDRFGWPSRVRTDWGGENEIVKALMEEARGPGRGSFLAGPSTHNQRIESEFLCLFLISLLSCTVLGLWHDVFAWTLQAFYTLFSVMEDRGILNPDEPLQLWALHFIFLPRINRALNMFTQTWNNHKLSSERNKTPLQLFRRGMYFVPNLNCGLITGIGLLDAHQRGFVLNLYPGNRLDDADEDVAAHAGVNFTLYGADFKGAQRERRAADPHVMFDPPEPPFPMLNLQLLDQCTADIDEDDDFLGVAKYERVVHFIMNMAQEQT